MAPEDRDGARGGDVRPATVLVKGIDPATGPEVIDLVEHLARASGSAAQVDELVGRVLTQLNASGYANSTITVLMSDHGYALGEHNQFAK